MIHTHTHTTIHLSVYILRANSSLLAISIEPKPYTQFISYARSIISVQSLSYYYFEFSKLFSITEYTTSFCLPLSFSLSIFVICIQISSIISTSHSTTQLNPESTHSTLNSFTFV